MAKFSTKEINEGSATLKIPTEDKISKKLPVFYNPMMQSNRDLTILALQSLNKTNMKMVDLMAGSGIRAIRFLKELPKEMINELVINDANPNAIKLIEKNLKHNKCNQENIILSNTTADKLLAESKVVDYIDVDPFGTPNPFLDLAVKKIINKGILAVTATDTAPLCGTYPKACQRKYWAVPRRDDQKHEWAARILIRKVQLIGAQYEKALIPIVTWTKHHYIRIIFKVMQGKSHINKRVLPFHQMIEDSGPLWTGELHDEKLTQEMHNNAPDHLKKFTAILAKESKIKTVGFIDLHQLAKETKISLPKYELIEKEINKQKEQVSKTIFSDKGIRTTAKKEKIKKIMRKLSQI